MNYQKSGFILLSTVIIIALITLFLLTEMRAVWLYNQLNIQEVFAHNALYDLESIVSKIGMQDQIYKQEQCISGSLNPASKSRNVEIGIKKIVELITQHKACIWHATEGDYAYLIDYLGVFPCVQMKIRGRVYSSEHWLITVAAPQSNEDSKLMLLQQRIAKPIEQIVCTQFNPRYLHSGVISSRVFYD